jgi:spermidine synthase
MINDFSKDRVINSNIELKYYNEDIHLASTALPSFLRNELNG